MPISSSRGWRIDGSIPLWRLCDDKYLRDRASMMRSDHPDQDFFWTDVIETNDRNIAKVDLGKTTIIDKHYLDFNHPQKLPDNCGIISNRLLEM